MSILQLARRLQNSEHSRAIGQGRHLILAAQRQSDIDPLHRHRGLVIPALSTSYVKGPTEPPLATETLPEFFENRVLASFSSRPALICPQEKAGRFGGPDKHLSLSGIRLEWSFEDLWRHSHALAAGLRRMGITKGDRVAALMGNCSAYAMLQWGAAIAGVILVTINPAYKMSELHVCLRQVGVKALFLVPYLRTSAYLDLLSESLPSLRSSFKPGEIEEASLPELRHIVVVNDTSERTFNALSCITDFRDTLDWQASPINYSGLQKDDTINLQFTSGTTGLPKAVALSHYNLLNNGILIGDCMKLTESDVLCKLSVCNFTLLKSYIVKGNSSRTYLSFPQTRLVLGNLAAWTHASCIVYPSPSFDAKAIVRTLQDDSHPGSPTALHGVPTHFLSILAELNRLQREGNPVDLSSRRLRTGIAAGSPIPVELIRKLVNQMGLNELTIAFGMTETSPVSFQTTTRDPLIKRVETVGRIHPHVTAKIVDSDRKVVPVGTPGEILIAGYLLQRGYWNDDKQTAQVMKSDEEGTLWMHTGDEGILDQEGYLRVVGRIKDIIIRGGENLFPVQIENVAGAHPAVAEVAAVSVPDPKLGEAVGIWVILVPSHTEFDPVELRRFIAARMNSQNAPDWIWIVGSDGPETDLPKTASGKVQKNILREWSKDLASRNVGRVMK